MDIIRNAYFLIVIIAHLALVARLIILHYCDSQYRRSAIIPNRIFFAIFDMQLNTNLSRLTIKRELKLLIECWIPVLFVMSIRTSVEIIFSFIKFKKRTK
jgi:hypothetical protein